MFLKLYAHKCVTGMRTLIIAVHIVKKVFEMQAKIFTLPIVLTKSYHSTDKTHQELLYSIQGMVFIRGG